MALPLEHLTMLPPPNEPVVLLEGTFHLNLPGFDHALTADTRLELAWGSRPGIRAVATVRGIPLRPLPKIQDATIHINGTDVSCIVQRCKDIVERTGARELRLTLLPCATFHLGNGKDLRRIKFGLVNFCDYVGACIDGEGLDFWRGRLVLVAGEWKFTLDARNNMDRLAELMAEHGGYAVTHAGQLERLDGKCFDIADAEPVLSALHFLLSFVRGHRVSLVLETGQDVLNNDTWRRVLHPTTDSWADPLTWFDPQRPESLQRILEYMVVHWQSVEWRETFQLGLYWYFLAQATVSNSDTSVVLSTTGLDLIACFRLVESEQTMSRTEFEGIALEKRIRELLSLSNINPHISSALPHLLAHSVMQDWTDGPEALGKLRNSVIHPRRRNQVFGVPDEVRWEACTLALHYLELTLLAMVGYEGTYINRVEHRHDYGLMYVPWMRETSDADDS